MRPGPLIAVTATSYENDDQRIRRLPKEWSESADGPSRITRDSYESLGRMSQETTAADSPDAATWAADSYQTGTQCASSSTDPLGAVTTQTCNARGQVTSETLHARSTFDQPSQDRTTSYGYDGVGRTITEDAPGDALTTYIYDHAGRVLTEDVLVDVGVHAVTSYTYDDAGRMTSESRPDAGVVSYDYDWANNEISETDPLAEEDWRRESIALDLGQAIQSMMLAAWDLGIVSVHGSVYDEPSIGDLLGYPEAYRCDTLISFGYPVNPEILVRGKAPQARKPLSETVHRGRW